MNSLKSCQTHLARLTEAVLETDCASNPVFSTDSLDVNEGVAVYRNNLKLGWRNALAGVYPVLEQLVGRDGFTLVARDYLKQYPSLSGDLNALGEKLNEFLHDYEPLKDFSYLSAVAQLEWHIHRSNYAQDSVSLTAADLMAKGADDWLESKVSAAPSAFILTTDCRAGSIWLAHQEGGNVSELQFVALDEPECLLISRPRWRVQVRVLSEGQANFLKALINGSSFEQAFDHVEAGHLPFDFVEFLPVCVEAGVWCQATQK